MSFSFNPADFDAIIFDFGGVLYNIDYQLPVIEFRSLGLENFESIYAKSGQNNLIDDLETGKITGTEFLEKLSSFFEENIGHQQILKAWNSILLDLPESRIKLLHRLKINYKIYLLSNTNELHAECFESQIKNSIGLNFFRSAFDGIHYSHTLGMRKPHIETFQAVCNMHHIQPERCLFIDDSIQHVEGALSAGLCAYHFKVGKDDVEELFKNWK